MKKIRFLRPKGLTIDGAARGFVKGDVRDYIPEDLCQFLVNNGDAEYVQDKPVKKEANPEAEKKQEPVANKEDKLFKPSSKKDK